MNWLSRVIFWPDQQICCNPAQAGVLQYYSSGQLISHVNQHKLRAHQQAFKLNIQMIEFAREQEMSEVWEKDFLQYLMSN